MFRKTNGRTFFAASLSCNNYALCSTDKKQVHVIFPIAPDCINLHQDRLLDYPPFVTFDDNHVAAARCVYYDDVISFTPGSQVPALLWLIFI